MAPANPLSFVQSILGPASPIPTPCLVLKGMFDPAECAPPLANHERRSLLSSPDAVETSDCVPAISSDCI